MGITYELDCVSRALFHLSLDILAAVGVGDPTEKSARGRGLTGALDMLRPELGHDPAGRRTSRHPALAATVPVVDQILAQRDLA
jgi:hypothetical protein